MNNACFKVFHLPGTSPHRNGSFIDTTNYLSESFVELDTPTIEVSNDKDVINFISSTEFNLDLSGYNLDNIQGWKYGEIGILASNYMAWKNFLKGDFEYVILMEDDIDCRKNFPYMLNNYASQLPENWEVFSCFVPDSEYHKFDGSQEIGQSDVCRSYQDWSMLCYVLNRRGAEKLIHHVETTSVALPLDWLIYRQTHIFKVYGLKPTSKPPCTLKNIPSTFQHKHERKVLNGIL